MMIFLKKALLINWLNEIMFYYLSPEKSIFPVLVFVDMFNVIFDNCHTSSASKHSNCLQHTPEQRKKRANSRSLAVL